MTQYSKNAYLFWLCFFLNVSLLAQNKDYENAYNQAIKAFNENKPKEGYELLTKAIGLSPTYYDALYARSYYLMQDGEYERALRDYDLLLLLYPQDTTLYLYRGQAKVALNMLEEAESDYLQAYEKDSTKSEIINALASLYFAMGLYEDSHFYLDKSLKINDKDIFAHYYKGFAYFKQTKFDLALNEVNTCLKIDAKDTDAPRLKAMILITQKKYKEAILIYEDLQKRNVDFDLDDFFYWGMAYYEQKKYKDALFYFDLPEKPASGEIYQYRGRSKFLMSRAKEALPDLDSAITYFEGNNEASAIAYYDRGVLKSKLKNLAEAEKDYFQACFLMPEIAFQKNQEGKPVNLLADLYSLLKINQKTKVLDSIRIQGFQERTETLIADGDTNKALKEINKALAIDSLHSFSYTLRGTVKAMLAQYPAALKDLEKAERLVKGRKPERVAYVKGLVNTELLNYAEARKNFLKAIELNPKDATYWSELATVDYQSSDYPNALKSINEAIKLDAENLEFYNERGSYYLANKEYDKALEDCNKVIKMDNENLRAYYNRGLIFQHLKRFSEAIADFSKVLQMFPNDAEVSNLLKDTLNKMEKQK
jgi:tetratricopeptide (TPR) repeat protein